MSNFNNQESQRGNILIVCIALIAVLVGVVGIDVATALVNDKPAFTSKLTKSGGVNYRFRAIFKGKMPSGVSHSNTTMVAMPSVVPSVSMTSGSKPASSVPQVRMSSAAASGGEGIATTSSAQLHSYGGGASMSGSATTSSRTTTPSATYAVGSVSVPSLAAVRHRVPVEYGRERAPSRYFAPSRGGGYNGEIVEDGGHNWQWDEDLGDDGDWRDLGVVNPLEPPHQAGDTKFEGGKQYTWNGTEWILSASEVDNPIGSTPWVLMLLLLAAYAYIRRDMAKKLEQM